jgi:phospholipid/cholesterol/gamma-HCH transport system permease protein
MGMQTTREPSSIAGAETAAEKYLPPPPRRAPWPERRLAILGHGAERFFEHAGGMATLLWRTLVYLFTGRIALRELINQIYWMGVGSIPIVLVTGTLAGIVTSQQGGYQFTSGVPLYILGSVVTSSIVLELGPVMTAVVLIGRVGARITAEIGTMKVSEQIDALESLGRDPVRTLVAPRIIAGIIAVPLLAGMADAVGVFAGMIAAQARAGLPLVPVRRAAVLAQLGHVLLPLQGGRVRPGDPAGGQPHGAGHAGRRGGRGALHHGRGGDHDAGGAHP